MIAQWKRPADVEKLHAEVGQLLVEQDFLRDASVRLGVLRGGKLKVGKTLFFVRSSTINH